MESGEGFDKPSPLSFPKSYFSVLIMRRLAERDLDLNGLPVAHH